MNAPLSLSAAIQCAAAAFWLAGLAAMLTDRLAPYQCSGLVTLSNALLLIQDALTDQRPAMAGNIAVGAWCAYWWWHGGGGDGARRAPRALRRGFTAVRRTAPPPR